MMKIDKRINNLLVSVIIPLYNQKKFIGEAIDSVLSQTYENIEIIVVNDGSTDVPESVLENYTGKIKIINQVNKGLSAARNTGIINSKGGYLQFLDADDILKEDKIEKQLGFNLKNNYDISYCDIYITDENRTEKRFLEIGSIENLFKYYYLYWYPYPTPIHSLLIKRDVFDKHGLFNEELRANEDRYYFCILSSRQIKFSYLNIEGGLYRLHGNSMNKDIELMFSSAIDFYRELNNTLGDKIIREYTGMSGEEALRANITFLYLTYIIKGYKARDLKKIKNILKSLELKLYFKPLPSSFKRNKPFMMLFSAYVKRYIGLFKLSKKGKLEL